MHFTVGAPCRTRASQLRQVADLVRLLADFLDREFGQQFLAGDGHGAHLADHDAGGEVGQMQRLGRLEPGPPSPRPAVAMTVSPAPSTSNTWRAMAADGACASRRGA